MATIGPAWADGAWIQASWATGAWAAFVAAITAVYIPTFRPRRR